LRLLAGNRTRLVREPVSRWRPAKPRARWKIVPSGRFIIAFRQIASSAGGTVASYFDAVEGQLPSPFRALVQQDGFGYHDP